MKQVLNDLRFGVRNHKWSFCATSLLIALAVAVIVSEHNLSAAARNRVLSDLSALGADVRLVTASDPVGARVLDAGAYDRLSELEAVMSVAELRSVPDVSVEPTPMTPELAGHISVLGYREKIAPSAAIKPRLSEASGAVPIGAVGSIAAQRLGVERLPATLSIGSRTGTDAFDLVILTILPDDPLLVRLRSSVLVDPAVIERGGLVLGPAELVVRVRNSLDESVLAYAADPLHPEVVVVSRPAVLEAALRKSNDTLALFARALAGSLATFALLSIGIMLSYSVRQRSAEIGLRRCLGARGTNIALLVGFEGLAGGILGASLGISVGLAVAWGWGTSHDWPIQLDFVQACLSGIAGVGVGLGASLLPAALAVRVDPSIAVAADV